MHDEQPAGPERGLPKPQGEFAVSLPWIARFLLSAAIGASVGFAASIVLTLPRAGPAGGWFMVLAGALAATLLSIRRIHGWHISTFADGTLVGLVAGPVFVVLVFVGAALQPGAHVTFAALWQALLALSFSFLGMVITLPCGWLAGFAYHVALSAAERARAKEDESA